MCSFPKGVYIHVHVSTIPQKENNLTCIPALRLFNATQLSVNERSAIPTQLALEESALLILVEYRHKIFTALHLVYEVQSMCI